MLKYYAFPKHFSVSKDKCPLVHMLRVKPMSFLHLVWYLIYVSYQCSRLKVRNENWLGNIPQK